MRSVGCGFRFRVIGGHHWSLFLPPAACCDDRLDCKRTTNGPRTQFRRIQAIERVPLLLSCGPRLAKRRPFAHVSPPQFLRRVLEGSCLPANQRLSPGPAIRDSSTCLTSYILYRGIGPLHILTKVGATYTSPSRTGPRSTPSSNNGCAVQPCLVTGLSRSAPLKGFTI